MSRDKQKESEQYTATERWLLARGYFMDCKTCDTRKEGCHKDCKFLKAYKERSRR